MTEHPKVLLVDDDQGIREALTLLFSTVGYEVESAINGEDAISQLRMATSYPCIILLDLMMPLKDGIAFRQEQLQDPKLAHIPVVLLSAHSHLEEKMAGVCVQAYCRKPVDIDVLLGLVEKHKLN